MKIKLTPGGMLILIILFIVIVYLLVRLIIGIFKTDGQDEKKIKPDNVATKMSDRNFKVGYVKGNLPENISFATQQNETSTSSIFKQNGLNVELIECRDYTELANLLRYGGDKNGVDVAYCNTNQFVQKSSLFSESNSKIFLLSDKETEKDYLIVSKSIKNVKDLDNKVIFVNETNSSTHALAQLLNQNKVNSANIVFSTDDKSSYDKLLSGEVVAILVKEQFILDEIKNNKNYKTLHELKSSNSNVFISSNSTLEEYDPYIKTFSKCCLIANDTLRTKKELYPNVSFADIGSNYSYFSAEPKKTSSVIESEISSIFNSLHKFIATENLIIPRDLVSVQTFSNIYSASGKQDTISLPAKKDTLFAVKEKIDNKQSSTEEVNQQQPKRTNYEHQNNLSPTTKKQSNISKTQSNKKKRTSTKRSNTRRTASSKNTYKDPEIENNHFIVNFDFNSIGIDTTASRKLSLVAEDIKKADSSSKVELIGHTDFYGKDSYNLMLSKKRAVSVMNYLNENFEIDTSKFVITGKGESSPIRNNRDNKVRKYNRRVNIEIKEDDK